MNKHERPATYRIIFRNGTWVHKSERYYTVYHSSEALDDIYHTFHSGKLSRKSITIYKIEEWITFRDEWIDRLTEALEHATELRGVDINDGKIVLRRISNNK